MFSVLMMLGRTQLTLIPWSFTSAERDSVNRITAALLREKAERLAEPFSPARAPTLTILPRPTFSM